MGEKQPTRREENARATRSVLLATGRELFAERGFAGAGIEEIAARAGVTTGALYHHFGNKRGLFRAVAEGMEVELMGGQSSSLPNTPTPCGGSKPASRPH